MCTNFVNVVQINGYQSHDKPKSVEGEWNQVTRRQEEMSKYVMTS